MKRTGLLCQVSFRTSILSTDKRAPSPLTATDCARGTENQAMPAWITIAKQKQKIMELEISRGKKPLAHDKADAEKPIKEREIMEVSRILPA